MADVLHETNQKESLPSSSQCEGEEILNEPSSKNSTLGETFKTSSTQLVATVDVNISDKQQSSEFSKTKSNISSPSRSKKQKKEDFIQFCQPILKRFDTLPVVEIYDRCKSARIKITGSPATSRAKLREAYKKCCQKIFNKMNWIPQQPMQQYMFQYVQYFDYLVVVDFEATCYQDNPPNFEHEIIQFPAVLIDVQTRSIIDHFNVFCKPKINPTLSDFCVNLTGITQEMVDESEDFPHALNMFTQWLNNHELGSKYRFAIVCDGAMDMGKFLHTQCEISKIPYPQYASRWVNIRKSFCNFYGVKWYNLRVMLEIIGQPFQGRPHDGLDDSRNIGNIVIRLLIDGCSITENERILLSKAEQERNAILQQQERKMYSLSTVENMTKQQFFRFYNWGAVPIELEHSIDKENVVSAKSGGNNGNGGNGSRQNKRRNKGKNKKSGDQKETSEVSCSAGNTTETVGSSEILVVSAKGLLD